MRHVMFVLCFTAGVTLMIFSGNMPRAASARTDAGNGTVDAVHGSARSGEAARPARPEPPKAVPVPRTTQRPTTIGDADTADSRSPGQSEELDPEAEQAEIQQNVARALEGLDEDLEDTLATADENSEASPPLKADAGPDRVVWIGWDDIALDGSASVGEELTCVWKQISGPTHLDIRRPRRLVTRATGFPLSLDMGWKPLLYEFELTVTDRDGRQATDTVGYIILPGPELTIRPPAQRRFEMRDGYVLGHYTSWASSAGQDPVSFEVASPTGLFFTQISGPDCDVQGGPTGEQFVYRITVHSGSDRTTSWLEFLVDTDEKIPGILQLGVNWE